MVRKNYLILWSYKEDMKWLNEFRDLLLFKNKEGRIVNLMVYIVIVGTIVAITYHLINGTF